MGRRARERRLLRVDISAADGRVRVSVVVEREAAGVMRDGGEVRDGVDTQRGDTAHGGDVVAAHGHEFREQLVERVRRPVGDVRIHRRHDRREVARECAETIDGLRRVLEDARQIGLRDRDAQSLAEIRKDV